MKYDSSQILLVVDLAATVFLGVEGAMAAVDGNLDIFGILVLSFATALGGGVIRDLLIGAIPPAATRDPRYAVAAFAGGAATFFSYRMVQEVPNGLLLGFDAAGLALFAVAGAAKALDYEIRPFMAVLMGTITGVGGGTFRDIFLGRVPAILRVDVYAVAALAGAAVMVVGVRLGVPRKWMMPAGAAVCFLLREYAVWRHLNLPKASG
jgi:uncharacterized membrane protein YeiH